MLVGEVWLGSGQSSMAMTVGETVIVSSPEVALPAAVRYAWKDWPEYSLANGAGLPASPFRTDEWPVSAAEP